MQYAEALREVKKAETEVRDLKTDADRQAAQTVREAERQANAMLEGARKESDTAYATALDTARKSGEKERAKLLQKGEADAQLVSARAKGPAFKQAADVLLANFEKHIARK